jgi:hypothetical protein
MENLNGTPLLYNWEGYSFERVCLWHIEEIKQALGISGIRSSVYEFHNRNTQIDLVIDRADNIVNLVEIKFTINNFRVTKEYYETLENKKENLRKYIKNKAIQLILISASNVETNEYSVKFSKIIYLSKLFYPIIIDL